MHAVIDQPHMTPHRDAAPGSGEVGLGGDSVLVIAQVIGRVGKQFDQRYRQVGHVPLAPLGHGQRQPVVHQLPEACEVLRQVINLGPLGCRRRTFLILAAIEVARAVDPEAEAGTGVAGIDAGHRLPCVVLAALLRRLFHQA